MPKVDIRIDKPEMCFRFKEMKNGEAFWCTDGYLNIKSKCGDKATLLSDGQIWTPRPEELVRPANVAVIGI